MFSVRQISDSNKSNESFEDPGSKAWDIVSIRYIALLICAVAGQSFLTASACPDRNQPRGYVV